MQAELEANPLEGVPNDFLLLAFSMFGSVLVPSLGSIRANGFASSIATDARRQYLCTVCDVEESLPFVGLYPATDLVSNARTQLHFP